MFKGTVCILTKMVFCDGESEMRRLGRHVQ